MNIMRRSLAICMLVLSLLISGCAPGQLFGPARFISISVGNISGCVLTSSGGVKCWGMNLQMISDIHTGVEATGTAIGGSALADVSEFPNGVSAIAVGSEHVCALIAGGGVKCWGLNPNGQLGDGTLTSHHKPEYVSGLTSGVSAITAGYDYNCVLTVGGGVKCWGDNQDGQLGDGTRTNRRMPVDVSGLTSGVSAIAAGDNQTCALTAGGGVKCWGNNSVGQLGDGTTTSHPTPVDVIGLTSGVKAIAVGAYNVCALTLGGGVKCWGINDEGAVGDGTTTNRLTPVDVSGLTRGVSAIDSGITAWYCALTAGNRIKCWGSNYYGRLGDGTITTRLTPVDVVIP